MAGEHGEQAGRTQHRGTREAEFGQVPSKPGAVPEFQWEEEEGHDSFSGSVSRGLDSEYMGISVKGDSTTCAVEITASSRTFTGCQ